MFRCWRRARVAAVTGISRGAAFPGLLSVAAAQWVKRKMAVFSIRPYKGSVAVWFPGWAHRVRDCKFSPVIANGLPWWCYQLCVSTCFPWLTLTAVPGVDFQSRRILFAVLPGMVPIKDFPDGEQRRALFSFKKRYYSGCEVLRSCRACAVGASPL